MASNVTPMNVDDMDEDDDIILISEEKRPRMAAEEKNGTNRGNDGIKFCKAVKEQIKAAKKEIEVTEQEIKLLSRELKSMESCVGDQVYERLKFLIENPDCTVVVDADEDAIIDMISEQMKEMGVVEELSRSRSRVINEKLSVLERANQSVSKVLLQCHTKLKTYGQAISEESEFVTAEIEKYEKLLSTSTINVDDDEDVDNSDDDVKIVDEPSSETSSHVSVPAQNLAKPKPVQQNVSETQEIQDKSRPSTSYNFNSSIPSIDQLRSQFASVVTSQMPGLMTSLNKQQDTGKVPTTAQVNQWQADINFGPLKVGDKVLGKKFNDVWYSGTIMDITSTPGDPEWKCRVKFDGKGIKNLSGKHLAYRESIKSLVRVGSRVVALYKEEDAPSTFYAGIIAEAPSMKNSKRFLVFFDDGYAQYCHSSEIHKVYMQSENVWEDIHPDTSSFIKEYLDIYPERPMVRLAKGQVVRTEWNGKWWTAKVLEIDASLVKMVFQSDRRTEWIYRGSTRLEPLFRALTNANAIKAAGSSKGRRLNLTMKPSTAHNKPSVEYTRGSVEEVGSASTSKPKTSANNTSKGAKPAEPSKKRANLAKKSTAGNPPEAKTVAAKQQWEAPWLKYQRKATPEQRKIATSQSDPSNPAISRLQSSSASQAFSTAVTAFNKRSSDYATLLQERLAKSMDQMEYDEERAMGKRQDLQIDTKGKSREKFVPHRCSPSCIKDLDDDPLKFRGKNPLLIPLYCSWERQVCKARPLAKRFVLYRTPCGRRLRSLEEVDKYLMVTNSLLMIDLFTFDHHLHVCTEFVPVKTFCDIKDLSYGKENYPVSCVNGIDRQYPDYLEYSNYRIPTENVHLNLDPAFLACCDCTDNCRDRSKCACQQLTIENTSCIGQVDSNAGYHNRRLPEPLFTGIYECNSRCACDKRCQNRVAQLGLRTRLQVFKTEKKGWGLRCLDDISKGSFICIYAGQLLTDKGANEDGKQYGDEYLAELDFIEVVEGQKEGYESDVEFSDDQNDKNYSFSKDSDDSDFSMSGTVGDVGERRSTRRRKTKDSDKKEPTSGAPQTAKTEGEAKATPAITNTPISISDEDEDDDSKDSKDNSIKTDTKDAKPEKKEMTPPSVGVSKTNPGTSKQGEVRRRARKSTGGSRLNLSISIKTQETISEEDESKGEKKRERIPTRTFFHDNTECYIMDAKSMGNLGRYLNHSCSPNVFVQNIFVDTHDLRFPWVSFFAGQYIRAGTELTWDYNYEVGSVPNKILYCYCGSSLCRGRLL